jgi:hypothetical protein
MAFATALGVVAVPVLRLLCWMIPPLDRALNDTAPARMGAAFRKRDQGDHEGAFATAMEGLARCAAATSRQRAMLPVELQWWEFLRIAAQEAEHLGEAERAQVAEALDTAPAPGGMLAAECLSLVARWTWTSGNRNGAIRLARQAILADPSSVDAHVLLGWYGLVTGRFDPLPHLREALKVDPSCREAIRTNPDFAGAPGLLRSLGLGDAA